MADLFLTEGYKLEQYARHFIEQVRRVMEETANTNAEGEKSFAELLDEAEPERGWMKPGQRVDAVVVKVTPEWVFIDVGGKHEGYLDRREFLDAEGNPTVSEGQTLSCLCASRRPLRSRTRLLFGCCTGPSGAV